MATYSDRVRPSAEFRLWMLVPLLFPAVAPAQSVVTQAEALSMAFPDAVATRRTAFLDEQQVEQARALAGSGVEVDQSVVTYYLATRADGTDAVAYFDAHRVRTLPEALMFVVDADATLVSVRVLKFAEPPEYRAPDGWLDRLNGHRLDDELRLKRGVDGITGATLTSEAVTDAARRVLAYHEVIRPLEASP